MFSCKILKLARRYRRCRRGRHPFFMNLYKFLKNHTINNASPYITHTSMGSRDLRRSSYCIYNEEEFRNLYIEEIINGKEISIVERFTKTIRVAIDFDFLLDSDSLESVGINMKELVKLINSCVIEFFGSEEMVQLTVLTSTAVPKGSSYKYGVHFIYPFLKTNCEEMMVLRSLALSKDWSLVFLENVTLATELTNVFDEALYTNVRSLRMPYSVKGEDDGRIYKVTGIYDCNGELVKRLTLHARKNISFAISVSCVRYGSAENERKTSKTVKLSENHAFVEKLCLEVDPRFKDCLPDFSKVKQYGSSFLITYSSCFCKIKDGYHSDNSSSFFMVSEDCCEQRCSSSHCIGLSKLSGWPRIKLDHPILCI